MKSSAWLCEKYESTFKPNSPDGAFKFSLDLDAGGN